jgi:hypothetical protein
MSRTLIPSVVCAIVAAMWCSLNADTRSFEERLERALISEQVAASESGCSVSQRVIDKADTALLSICLVHGMDAFLAVTKYREQGLKLFALYGDEPELRLAIERYGSQVIPVVAYFLENGSAYYQGKQAIGDAVSRWWAGEGVGWRYSNITREQIGLIALHQIMQRGNEMLAEFEIVDGIAKSRPVTNVLFGAKDFFLGGVFNLEKILVRGKRLPTLMELGEAGADAIVVAGALKVLAKVSRLGSVKLAKEQSLRSSVRSAYDALGTIARTGRRAGPYALAYVAITQPDLLASAGGWIAEQLGMPRIVGVFVVYAVGLWLLIQFFVTPVVLGWIALTSYRLARGVFGSRRRYAEAASR